MKKRILSLFLILLLVVSVLTAFPVAANAENNITWELDSGTLTISGTGEMTSAPWRTSGVIEKIYRVVVEEGVTKLSDYAFGSCKTLRYISLPKSIKEISKGAFSDCSSLESVTIDDWIETINDYAFYKCSALKQISLANVKNIGYGAFAYCYSLENVVIPDSVEEIGSSAFLQCKALKKITLGKKLRNFDGSVLAFCSALKEVEISPENENYCIENGFLYSKDKKTLIYVFPTTLATITELTLSEGLEIIGSEAFYNCVFTKVNFPESLKEIGYGAFRGCQNIESVTLGNNVEVIGSYSFANCSALKNVNYGSSIKTIGSYAFNNCTSLSGKHYVPEGVTSLGEFAYSGCSGIEELVISSTVEELTKNVAGMVQKLTFAPGSKIQVIKQNSFTISPKVVIFPKSAKILEKQAFYMCDEIEEISFEEGSELEEIGSQAVFSCQNFVSFTIPDKVKTIGKSPISYCPKFANLKLLSKDSNFVIDNGFLIDKVNKILILGTNKGISSYTVPDYVEEIYTHCFYSLTNLKTLVIPKSVKKISSWALYGANGLVNLTIPFIGTERGTSGTQYAVFGSIFGDLGVGGDVSISNGVVQKYSETMNTGMLRGYYVPSTLRNVTITDETVVPYGAFYNCSMLTSITLPETVKEIKPFAFYKCSGISKINIPKNVNQISNCAFSGCTSLSTVNYSGSEYAWSLVDIKGANEKIISAKKNFLGQSVAAITPEITVTDTEGGKIVNIASTEDDVRIYYTIDGSVPTLNSKLFEKELFFDKECNITIKAISVKYGCDASAVAQKNISVAKLNVPTASAESGIVNPGEGILLLSDDENAEIYYTTDGKDPVGYGEIYTGEINIELPATIKAVSVKDGFIDSSIAMFRYVESYEQPQVKVLSTSAVGKSSAVLKAEITNESKLCLPEISFTYYSINTPNEKNTVSTNGESTVKISNLNALTDYMFCVSIKNGDKVYTSEYTEFTTTDYDMPESVTLSKTELKLPIGGVKTIKATVYPETANNKNVTWKSNAPAVAYVDKNGQIFGKKAGSAIITAKAEGEVVAECRVVVYEKYVTGEYDFSEINMATNTRDFAENGFDFPVEGGNAVHAISYLARWDGVVAEANDKYPPHYSSAENGYDLAYLYNEREADYHVQNIYFLRRRQSASDNAEIKEALMKYGAVSTSFYASGEKFYGASYYMPYGVTTANHAVAIVGWDDNYSRTNFRDTPPGDGAFICKNSWGRDVHADGFFYISYYDCALGKYEESYVIPELESKTNYDNIFQYDMIGPSNKLGYTGTTYAANVFPQKDKKLTKDELLKAVSFYTVAQNMSYEIYVVPEYINSSSLASAGEPVLSGTLKEMGYHTLNLDDEILLKEGTRFAVIVKLSSNDSTKDANFFIESPVTYYSKARAGTDESFMSPDGSTWIDIGEKLDNTNVCIKAFTDDTSSFDKLFKTVDEPKEIAVTPFTLRSNNVTGGGVLAASDDEDIYTGFLFPFLAFDSYLEPEVAQPELPVKYDLRTLGQVSAVKNQYRYGTCWTFSAYASLESSIMKRASETEKDLNVLGAKMTYDEENGKLIISSRHPAILYIATYDGAKMLSVDTYTLEENTLDAKFDFDENMVAYIWDENLISLCSKFSIVNH